MLHDVDLLIEGGSTFALVGPSGSGKSTLVALLARLYDPSQGRVTIDGCNLAQLQLASLRSAVAYVTQEPFLFSAIAENIAYARPEASLAEIEAAAEVAQAAEFIAALPDGYRNRIGERGLTLSGGQRQRLAIARALVARPRILVLDDATSALDASTERELLAALRRERVAPTTILVAQRPSAVRLADRIAVIEGGRVTAVGDHEELLARSSFYRELCGVVTERVSHHQPREVVG